MEKQSDGNIIVIIIVSQLSLQFQYKQKKTENREKRETEKKKTEKEFYTNMLHFILQGVTMTYDKVTKCHMSCHMIDMTPT